MQVVYKFSSSKYFFNNLTSLKQACVLRKNIQPSSFQLCIQHESRHPHPAMLDIVRAIDGHEGNSGSTEEDSGPMARRSRLHWSHNRDNNNPFLDEGIRKEASPTKRGWNVVLIGFIINYSKKRYWIWICVPYFALFMKNFSSSFYVLILFYLLLYLWMYTCKLLWSYYF